jgi:ELWxxDGT repeat protein
LTPIEEVKAPWTLLLLDNNNQLYTSDGTKTGSSVLASNNYISNTLVVNNDKTFALVKNYDGYDRVSNLDIVKAFSIKNSTDAPTFLSSDISYYATVLKVGSKLVITDSNYPGYRGLVTDGTVSGTTVFADLPSGIVDSNTQTIWSRYYSTPYGNELFKMVLTDASPNVALVKDINPGQDSGLDNIGSAILANGKLFFSAFNAATGYEPWFSDGTNSGTTSIDLYSGDNSSSPNSLIKFGNKVVFSANVNNWIKGSDTFTTGRELVFTDGTASGTNVLDIYTGANSSNPAIVGEANSLLYFTATAASGRGFYSTNETTFTKLTDIHSSATCLAWNTSKAFFSLSDSTNGGELWVADFTANTFYLVKDILPGTGSALSGDIGAFMINGKLMFKAYTSATEQNLFVSDGTSNGTVKIGNSLGSYAALGDTLVFADGNSIIASNLSGDAPSNVELVNASSAVVKMQSDIDQAFFSLANGDLYTTKGTLITTVTLASSVKNFKVVAENAIYLVTANTQSPTGYDLWYSDGTVAGTRFVEDVPVDVSTYLDNAVVIQTVGVNV